MRGEIENNYLCVAYFRDSTRMTVVLSILQTLKSNIEEASLPKYHIWQG